MSPDVPGKSLERVFEQPPDAVVCYSDLVQMTGSEHEIVIQFYESIPGPPQQPSGGPANVKSRLRASVIVSREHAAKIGNGLLQASATSVKPPVA
jgi:hypothetical protein